MDTLPDVDRLLTADEFLAIDRRAFDRRASADAWRYELIDGRVVATAPTTDEHAAILINVIRAVAAALEAASVPCRMYTGNRVRPANTPNKRVRIPDAGRNGERRRPVVLFEILSPSNQGPEYVGRLESLRASASARAWACSTPTSDRHHQERCLTQAS